ncbi:uncharacterized protein LOC133205437 [Saccostrea echinata]|uniref:uncharacterized protein LOC133205437 n=1 Tax=Saccostrea echinata TaxID=191078 RepID=UPI002A80E657|nr:uncharacterized protein LOC133205437 [Saccostrea echinata]XP_061197241.1 uncharacterized protein LOC133205437 [Saccostrea echinata]
MEEIKWILEYSVRNQLKTVTEAVLTRFDGQLSALGLSDVQLASSTLHDIVHNFLSDPIKLELAVDLMDFIYMSCPEAVVFKLYSKLVVGLKMQILLQMLKNKDKDCLTKLMKYFPRRKPEFPGVCPQQLSRLHMVHTNFRKFYLPLLANSRRAEAYFREEYSEEYGKEFHEALQKMCKWFVDKIQSYFPEPMLSQILENPDILKDCQHSPEIQMLMDIIQDKSILTSDDLLEFLTMVDPSNTQDRVQVPNTFSLSPRRCSVEDGNIVAINCSRNRNNHCTSCRDKNCSGIENFTFILSEGNELEKSRNSLYNKSVEQTLLNVTSGRGLRTENFTQRKMTKTTCQKSPDSTVITSERSKSSCFHEGQICEDLNTALSSEEMSSVTPEEQSSGRTLPSERSSDCIVITCVSPSEDVNNKTETRCHRDKDVDIDMTEGDIRMMTMEELSDTELSVSDIDRFSDIENDNQQQVEFTSDSSGGEITLERFQVPDISRHKRQQSTPLCVVKLFKSQVFKNHSIYS